MFFLLQSRETVKEGFNKGVANDLERAQERILKSHLSLIIVMGILAVFGCLGNLISAIFYWRMPQKSTTVIFIIGMSITDLLVCVMIIPNMKEMIDNVTNQNVALCKSTHFLGNTFISTSCLFKWLITIDRHRKICFPFGKQFSCRSTKYSCIGIATFALLVSVRKLLVYDIVTVSFPIQHKNKTIIGHYCTTRDDSWYVDVQSFFVTSDFVIILAVWMTTIISYVHIIFVVVKLKRRRRHLHKKCHSEDTEEMNGKRGKRSRCNLCNMLVEVQNSKTGNSSLSENVQAPGCSDQTSNVPANGPNERKLTCIMFVVSVVFLLSFIPYFVVRLVMRIVNQSGEEIELAVGRQLALKLVYLHSAFDPIIYLIFNEDFRGFIKHIVVEKCFHTVFRR